MKITEALQYVLTWYTIYNTKKTQKIRAP